LRFLPRKTSTSAHWAFKFFIFFNHSYQSIYLSTYHIRTGPLFPGRTGSAGLTGSSYSSCSCGSTSTRHRNTLDKNRFSLKIWFYQNYLTHYMQHNAFYSIQYISDWISRKNLSFLSSFFVFNKFQYVPAFL